MYQAIDLANYIVSKCIKDDKPINNLQLQAILYYIQKRFLQVNGSPAFKDNIEARHFGPCISNIYYHEAKLELLNNATIIFSDNIYKVIHNFIRDINDNIHEQSEKIYTYTKEGNKINIYKTSRTNYKNTLICSFELTL